MPLGAFVVNTINTTNIRRIEPPFWWDALFWMFANGEWDIQKGTQGHTIPVRTEHYTYVPERVLGSGAFGCVYQ